MEGKLIKVDNGWVLMVNNIMYATDNDKLSLKNCEAIENGYDLDELINRAFDNMGYHSTVTPYEEKQFKIGYRIAFREALEILGDKKFNYGHLDKMFTCGKLYQDSKNEAYCFDNVLNKFQQTEWDVEIEMECGEVRQCECSSNENCMNPKPKLDADGCLILKRK